MNENEFWAAYSDSQKKIELTENQKRTIIDAAKRHPRERAAAATAPNPSTSDQMSSQKASGARPSAKQHRPLGRIALPLAACLAVVALAVGLVVSSGNGGPFGLLNVTPDFSVQAYAADSDSILEMGTDNQIIFSRSADLYGIGDKQAYLDSEGYYTGCLFRIEGEGVTRIQASISTGVIYRYTTENITVGENPERWKELMSWKPTSRGLGEYYNGYDEVSVLGSADELTKDDPAKQWTVALTKKLGSTIDVPVDGTSECSFGLWTNEDYGNAEGMEAIDAIIDLFDGATLTVTATFDDGHTTTQVIELHAADVKASMDEREDGLWELSLTPEIVDSTGLEQYTGYIHTLYGTVIKTNHEPFPESLATANEFADVVSEPKVFDRQPPLRPISNLTFNELDLRSAAKGSEFTFEGNALFSIANVSMASHSRALPEGITLNDLYGGMSDWEYFNRVVSQIDGFTLDENGAIDGDFSWVVMEADIANAGAKTAEIPTDGVYYGELAVADGEGVISTASCRTFSLLNGGWDASKVDENLYLHLEPGGTTHVRWLAIVPDVVLDDPSLFFLTYTDDDSGIQFGGIELSTPSE